MATKTKIYDTFLLTPLVEGVTELTIRDLEPEDRREKYCHKRVKAEIRKSKFKGSEVLKINTAMGHSLPQDWYIKITEQLEPF